LINNPARLLPTYATGQMEGQTNMKFIWKPGKEMHIQEFDRTGTPLMVALCGEKFESGHRTCNLPLGQPRCKACEAMLEEVHNDANAACV